MKKTIKFKINGKIREIYVNPWQSLAEVLRENGYLSVKISCNNGICGSCTVIIDGKAIKSCLMLAMQAKEKEIITIEGLAKENKLHPLQEAFIDYYAVQCGYCTPGMILTAKTLLDENLELTEKDLRIGLDGNLCRCTGYVKIVEAIMAAKEKMLNNDLIKK